MGALAAIELRSPAFASFVAAVEEEPGMEKLSLPSMLMEPVQRLPRYLLLLRRAAAAAAALGVGSEADHSQNSDLSDLAAAIASYGGCRGEIG